MFFFYYYLKLPHTFLISIIQGILSKLLRAYNTVLGNGFTLHQVQFEMLNLLPILLYHICQYSLKYCAQHFGKIIYTDELHVISWTDVLESLKR